jgi:lipopolysaccharide biosynthesis protein
VPSDLGYYDLRSPEVRRQPADLASEAGVKAFAYHHYWFNGRQLLEEPVEDILRSELPEFPFILVWANENLTRRWDGGERKILMRQYPLRQTRDLVAYGKYALGLSSEPKYLLRADECQRFG